ncbi:hypothetical protein Tco_0963798 [Tanacetum coccineum]
MKLGKSITAAWRSVRSRSQERNYNTYTYISIRVSAIVVLRRAEDNCQELFTGRKADAAYLRKNVIYDVESREENGGVVGRPRTSLYSLNGKRKVKESGGRLLIIVTTAIDTIASMLTLMRKTTNHQLFLMKKKICKMKGTVQSVFYEEVVMYLMVKTLKNVRPWIVFWFSKKWESHQAREDNQYVTASCRDILTSQIHNKRLKRDLLLEKGGYFGLEWPSSTLRTRFAASK